VKFVNLARYTDDVAHVERVRPAHREYAGKIFRQGKLFTAGPFIDGAGALLVYEAENIEEAENLFRNDPFAIECVLIHSEIHRWNPLGLNASLMDPAAAS
jgi:uncharacterized protein YciI